MRKLDNTQINRTYSVTLLTVAQLSEMTHSQGVNASELVRIAVDDLYSRYIAKVEDQISEPQLNA